METSYLAQLDAMLAQELSEAIKARPEDVGLALKKLEQLTRLYEGNPRLKNKLRLAYQWVLERIELTEEQAAELRQRQEHLGGPIPLRPPVGAEDDGELAAPGRFQIDSLATVLADKISLPWRRVYEIRLEEFLAQITPIDGKYRASAASTLVDWRPLPFYREAILIRVHDPMWVGGHPVIYYLSVKGKLFRLNGTSPPIHEVNNSGQACITQDNVLDYLRFFCFFVRGDEGPFYILEHIDDPLLPEGVEQTTWSILDNTARPARVTGVNEKGYFLCEAVTFYANALFEANFAVHPDGMVEMLSDNPIAGELGARITAPIA